MAAVEPEPGHEAPAGELAAGPATKVLVEIQLAAYEEVRMNGLTPTLEKPHPSLGLLWLRVHAQVRRSPAPEARELLKGWADANARWRDPGLRDWKLKSAEAMHRLELLENYLHDSGWTDLKERAQDSLVPYLTREELEVSR